MLVCELDASTPSSRLCQKTAYTGLHLKKAGKPTVELACWANLSSLRCPVVSAAPDNFELCCQLMNFLLAAGPPKALCVLTLRSFFWLDQPTGLLGHPDSALQSLHLRASLAELWISWSGLPVLRANRPAGKWLLFYKSVGIAGVQHDFPRPMTFCHCSMNPHAPLEHGDVPLGPMAKALDHAGLSESVGFLVPLGGRDEIQKPWGSRGREIERLAAEVYHPMHALYWKHWQGRSNFLTRLRCVQRCAILSPTVESTTLRKH